MITISEKHFDEMLREFSKRNCEVRNLLQEFGDYNSIPKDFRDKIDSELNIKRVNEKIFRYFNI